ncbi:MAG TPA: hypothetical protein VMN36_19605 [Verrucomicrobiales bacterium]|nr:hypothetical protein [Verrucomicrobiales bacterium]
MELNLEQKKQVERWLTEGASLGEIQKRLKEELGIALTFMEARFLLSDLGLTLQEEPSGRRDLERSASLLGSEDPGGAASGGVAVSLDEVTPPHAIVSGKVTFSDGTKANWLLDQMGRLALDPSEPGYRPSAADMQGFQDRLRDLLERRGF